MIINLSPEAYNKAKQSGAHENKTAQQFVEEIINQLLSTESAYLILKPVPAPEKMQAVVTLIDIVINKPFFGLKFLTQEEALIEANKRMAEVEFNRKSHSVGENGGNYNCVTCGASEESLNEPCSSFFEFAESMVRLGEQNPPVPEGEGWELFKSVDGRLTTVYTFKRRKPPTKLTDAEIIASKPTQGDKVLQFPDSGRR